MSMPCRRLMTRRRRQGRVCCNAATFRLSGQTVPSTSCWHFAWFTARRRSRGHVWALREALRAYDAAYLALARALDARVLTTARGLAAAARSDRRLIEL